jgi:cell division protein ZapA
MKQIDVSILGQSYVLGCPDGGDALLQASVKAVDREMTAIRNAGKVKARERIAVLAALNLAYKLEQRPAATVPPSFASESVAEQVDVEALISRIDQALGEHGQLL